MEGNVLVRFLVSTGIPEAICLQREKIDFSLTFQSYRPWLVRQHPMVEVYSET